MHVWLKRTDNKESRPVGWGSRDAVSVFCRIHRLHLCSEVRIPQ